MNILNETQGNENKKQRQIETYLNQGCSACYGEKSPALCFQGQKSALLTESMRMNGLLRSLFFFPE